ncbi:MAG: citramalate synthase [Saprospiraceae bacterium]|nr:citramalate synthase [Saprospiraceae bacterium]
MKQNKVLIYDTTLRDGTQGEGISFSARDKVLIAKRMDQFKFDYIEGGWPGSNPRDMRFFELAKGIEFQHSKLAAFGSTRRANLAAEDDQQLHQLIKAETPVVTIFGKSWPLHVTDVLKTSLEENLNMIRESIAFLKNAGKEVLYDAEHYFDGYKNDSEYALQTLRAAIEGGADYIVLCDTNGGTQIVEFIQIVEEAIAICAPTPVGVHCHNDCGLGVALSLVGIEHGATMVQGTINGHGERIGNANLTSILPNLHFKLNYQISCGDQLTGLREFSIGLDKMANIAPNIKEAFVGASAFAHKGGVHANAAKKVARSYEHMQPQLVGNQQRILMSDMSGSSSVVLKARELGIDLDEKSDQMRAFLALIKEREDRGYEYENADGSFAVLLHQHFRGVTDNFELVSYRTISEVIRDSGTNISEAVVKLRVEDDQEIKMTIAESTGPVGALDHAMRKAFGLHFPMLRSVDLIDYKVRITQSGMGTESIVQVFMKSADEDGSWWTCGADGSIIEASYQALRDAFRYKLLKESLVEVATQ